MKLIKAMATVAGLTGISRILGFVRDILTAQFLGAGAIADAFFVALKLPNFFRRVTAEGAFSVSFVPMYSKKLEVEGQDQAGVFASNVFAFMVMFLAPFTLTAILAMPFIIQGIAPGFGGEGERYDLSLEMARITFPYLLLMSLAALLGGMLNASDRFAPFAAAPIFFNLCLIVALVFGTPFVESAGHAMAWGVFGAGIVQFLWLLVFIKQAKISLFLKLPKWDADIKQLFKLMGPGVIGAGVTHINLFADLIIASLLSAGSISYLYYADRLNQLPLGMVGIAVGTALLPMLSKTLAAKDFENAHNLFNRALEVCYLLAMPAAIALIIIPVEIITVLFERGAFEVQDTRITAYVLAAYALGLPPLIASKVCSSAYWAQQDTKTPVKISVVVTVINIGLSLVLMQYIGVAGIALATGLTGWLQFVLLKRYLKNYEFSKFDARLKLSVFHITMASLVMGLFLLGCAAFLGDVFAGDSQILKILALTGLVIGGALVYGFAVILSGVIRLAEIQQLLKRKV